MPIKRRFFKGSSISSNASLADSALLDIANPSNNPSKLINDPQRQMGLFEQLANGHTTLSVISSSLPKRSKWQTLIGLPAYHWILLAQLLVILPHIAYLPIWLIIFGLFTVAAQLPRVKASRFAKKRFYQSLQIFGFIGGLIGLALTYGLNLGVDVGVAFLLLCSICKLWELYKRRDAYVVLNLSLFVMAALFLMDQGLTATIEVLLGTAGVLLAFIAMNDDDNLDGSGRLRSFMLLAGFALPLMIILFLFFPRLPPLWSLQLSSKQATTGVSDSMAPGDFASLSQSTELAFRVEFQEPIPPQSELYWRGLVFSDFDGVTWTPSNQQKIWRSRSNPTAPNWLRLAFASVPKADKGNPKVYQITLEPTQQRWLYGLDYPFTEREDVAITSAFTLLRHSPISQQLRYRVMQFDDMRIDTQLSNASRQINTALPEQGNPKARQYAKTLYEQAQKDPVRYINAIRQWIGTDDFRYTLSPPPLQNERIDEFLFGTKAGFCEHFASSFTFLMRAVGIPARVVAGYQGGELGRDGSSWEVRQMDAHAWSEVWLDGQGWVRVDPTAFVAPSRVEEGMDALTQQRGASMFGTGAGAQISYQQFKMLQSLRRLSDQASYYWQRDIVGYDQDKQADSLFKWFNIKTVMQQVVWMVVTLAILMVIIISLIWYRRRKQWHPADVPILKLSKRVAKANPQLALQEDEGVLDWLTRLEASAELKQDTEQLQTIKSAYRRLRYGRQSMLEPKSNEYQLGLKQLKAHTKSVK